RRCLAPRRGRRRVVPRARRRRPRGGGTGRSGGAGGRRGVTIRKGEPWGEPGALPEDGIVVRSDAEARAVVTAARRAGEPVPPLGLLGGDLCRALGGTGDEARLRSG